MNLLDLPQFFQAGYVTWIPDRALSPSALLQLKERQIKNKSAADWPRTRLLNSQELALAWLRLEEQNHQCLLRPTVATSWELLQALSSMEWSDLSLVQRYLNFQRSRKYWSLGQNACDWASVLRELQQSAIENLKDETEQILTWLAIEGSLGKQKKSATDWSAVERLCELKLSPPAPEQISALFGLPPGEKFRGLVLPLGCELRPLEKQLLAKLRPLIPVIELSAPPEAPVSPEDFWKALRQSTTDSRPRPDSALYWAFPSSIPGPWEIDALCPLDEAISFDFPDLAPEDDSTLDHECLRSLELGLGYLKSQENPQHPYTKDPRFPKHLEAFGFEESPPRTARDFEKLFLRGGLDLNSEILGSLFERHRAWEIFEVLSLSGLLKARRPTLPLPQRFAQGGLPLVTLFDHTLMLSDRAFLWTSRKAFLDLLNPLSSFHLARHEYSGTLRRVLAAEGINLPDLREEVRTLAGTLYARRAHLQLLESQVEASQNLIAPPSLTAPVIKKQFSPSAIEAYASCPAKYFLERQNKLGSFTVWDPEQMDPLSLGSWVHHVLELFLRHPDWEKPQSRLQELFEKSLDQFFSEKTSPPYRTLLLAKASALSVQLEEHLQNFEREAERIYRPQKRWIEKSFEIPRGQTQLIGKIDRVDFVSDDAFFVWDYKTGAVDGKPESQIRRGKVQMWSYVMAVQHQVPGARFLGGGYLNPLASEKSQLYLSSSAAPELTGALVDLFQKVGHPYRLLSTKEEADYLRLTQEKISEIEKEILAGTFPTRPQTPSQCYRCDVRALCGRPFLWDDSAPLGGDAQ